MSPSLLVSGDQVWPTHVHDCGNAEVINATTSFNYNVDIEAHPFIDQQVASSSPSSPDSEKIRAAESPNPNDANDSAVSPFRFETIDDSGLLSQDLSQQSQQRNVQGQSLQTENLFNPVPVYTAYLARNNQFRRSISEPPAGLPYGPPSNVEPQGFPYVTFHRDQHYLGHPIRRNAETQKGISKAKHQRGRSNAPKRRQPPVHNRHVHSAKLQQQPIESSTQKPSHGYLQSRPTVQPTSAPFSDMLYQVSISDPDGQLGQLFEDSQIQTPSSASPLAREIFSPASQALPAEPRQQNQNISTQLTVEELREIVTQAVQNAMYGIDVSGSEKAESEAFQTNPESATIGGTDDQQRASKQL